jgi:hypothetical protein
VVLLRVHAKAGLTSSAELGEQRGRMQVEASAANCELADNECGRLVPTGAAVAVPFAGAVAASIVVTEMLKCVDGRYCLSESRTRDCLLGLRAPSRSGAARLLRLRGLRTVLAQSLGSLCSGIELARQQGHRLAAVAPDRTCSLRGASNGPDPNEGGAA